MSNVFKTLKESLEGLSQINLAENLNQIFAQPLGIVAVIALLIIMMVLVRAKKIKFTSRLITHIAVMLALAVVLDFLKIYRMPQGGSITLGGMVPIILISLWYGAEVGMLTGLLFGILSLILGPYVVHPVQLLLDYPLAFLALGTAGFFKSNKLVGTSIAVLLRFICHVTSGVIFFASYSEGTGHTPLIYSILYNGSFLLVDAIICIVILYLIPIDRLMKNIQKA